MTSVPRQSAAEETAADASAPAAGAAPDAAAESAPASASAEDRARAARRVGLRTLGVALPAGALGASLVLVAAGKTWSRGYAAFGETNLPVHASGTDTTALPGGLALVGLASLVAVFAVRRAGRYVVSALLALAGLGAVVVTLARRGSHAAVNEAAASTAGLAHDTARHVTTTGWPFVSVAGGLLLLAAGLLALRYGPSWPVMSSRYDAPGTTRPARTRAAAARRPAPVDPDRAEDLWKALDRGEDPTGPAV
ncbi:TIGR02234 family membrane protein [Streptomyces sp. NPDC021020]|uniref:TIGR02234 family membrane protein n=1 Tax=Streptomyces sp. NPDC021020 TaxID=3365109 RepID=UPI003789CDC9